MKVRLVLRKVLLMVFLAVAGCDFLDKINIVDIKEFEGSCTILLPDETTIIAPNGLEVSERTEAITFRDDDGKIWSLFKGEYESYNCN